MANVTLGENVTMEASMVCDGAVVHAGAVVGKGAVLSHDVVVGAGFVVPDYARLSLAEQPEANDDEYDSDEDGLEVGSFPNERRVSMTRDASGGSPVPTTRTPRAAREWRSGRRNANSSREPNAETSAEPKTPRACGPRTAWAWEARDTRGRRGGARREWRFSVAPAPAGAAKDAYDADDALDSDDDESHRRAGTKTNGDGEGGSDASEDEDEDGGMETVFRREVAETFLRCVKHGYAQANAVVELQGLKMAENRTFADIARYVLMTILGLSLPAPRDVTKENAKLYPSKAPESAGELLKGVKERVKQWAPLLTRFLKSEDDQVEMLLTLEDYCAEDEVFRGMGGALLVPAFAKILHMLYAMDVLSEVSVLAWAEEKEGAEEEDKRFLKLAQPFVDWLREADSESEEESSDEESSDEEE